MADLAPRVVAVLLMLAAAGAAPAASAEAVQVADLNSLPVNGDGLDLSPQVSLANAMRDLAMGVAGGALCILVRSRRLRVGSSTWIEPWPSLPPGADDNATRRVREPARLPLQSCMQ